MKKSLLFIGILSLLFACTTKLDTPSRPEKVQAPVLYATIEDGAETKVYLDEDYKVLWTADDRISVFNKNTTNLQYRYEGNSGDNSGTFSIIQEGGLAGSSLDYLLAVYPYNASISRTGENALTVFFPATQNYSFKSFGQGANTMVAVSDGEELSFKNACGYLMFKLYGDGVSVKSVALKGNNNEKIAGEATVTMTLGGTPSVIMSNSAANEIVLTCENAVALGTSSENYTEFWFAIPPVTFTRGFTVTVTDNEGNSFCKSTSNSVEIVRSYAKKMSPIDVTPVDQTKIPLTFKSIGSTNIALKKIGSPYSIVLQYQINDGAWVNYTISQEISLNDSETVSFRAGASGNSRFSREADDDGDPRYYFFTMNGGMVEAYGNIMSLLDQTMELTEFPQNYDSYDCFNHLFSGCTSLVSAPVLPATSLAPSCYEYMFSGCTSLVSAPVLPAMNLAGSCYMRMFENCTSLVSAPDLPATTLVGSYCYGGMFSGCSSLIIAPELPASTLAPYCYSSLFYGCTSLTEAPVLPATSLANGCYQTMFGGCTSLTTPPELPATTLTASCYSGMFSSCSSLTTAPELQATTLASNCYSSMFSGCTSLVSAPVLSATTLTGYCYQYMFSGCTSLTSAPELPATTLAQYCYQYMFKDCTSLKTPPSLPATSVQSSCYMGMFKGCSSLTTAPALSATTLAANCYREMFSGCTSLAFAPTLPAETLVSYCYQEMFRDCSKLKYIKALFTTTPSNNYTKDWVNGVASRGEFIKSVWATWSLIGNNGVPDGWEVEFGY